MQKTHLDRWLQKKYVYISHVYCNSLPRQLPRGIKLEETSAEMGGQYLYRFTVPTEKLLNELTAHLEVSNITYTSRIGEQGGLTGKLFNDPNKSFTMQVAWLLFIIAILAVIFSGLPVHLWNTLSEKEDPSKKQTIHLTVSPENNLS